MNKDIKTHIVSFSGGKDSTAMLLLMIEKNLPIDKIIYIDTTKEFPIMYNHIEKVENYIYPYKIEKLSFDFDYYMSKHIKVRGKNKGKLGYGWPDMMARWCTRCKISTYNKYISNYIKENNINKNNIIHYHGIAFDEQKRVKNTGIRYPLVEWKITEGDALHYCYNKGFTYNELYTKMNRVSCFCCPLQSLRDLEVIYTDYPNLWKIIEDMDKKSYRKFKYNYSVEELSNRFTKKNRIQKLF